MYLYYDKINFSKQIIVSYYKEIEKIDLIVTSLLLRARESYIIARRTDVSVIINK